MSLEWSDLEETCRECKGKGWHVEYQPKGSKPETVWCDECDRTGKGPAVGGALILLFLERYGDKS